MAAFARAFAECGCVLGLPWTVGDLTRRLTSGPAGPEAPDSGSRCGLAEFAVETLAAAPGGHPWHLPGWTQRTHGTPNGQVIFSPGGDTLYSPGLSDDIAAELDGPRELGAPVSNPANGVASLRFSPDGGRLAAVGVYGNVEVWDTTGPAWKGGSAPTPAHPSPAKNGIGTFPA